MEDAIYNGVKILFPEAQQLLCSTSETAGRNANS